MTDITEHWTGEGKLSRCAIKDLHSRKIVGYATSARIKSGLAVAALDDARRKRGHPRGVIVHFDRGSQPCSRSFRAALKTYHAKGPMGRAGAYGDNAAIESFCALVQKNVPNRQSWANRQELFVAIATVSKAPSTARDANARPVN